MDFFKFKMYDKLNKTIFACRYETNHALLQRRLTRTTEKTKSERKYNCFKNLFIDGVRRQAAFESK